MHTAGKVLQPAMPSSGSDVGQTAAVTGPQRVYQKMASDPGRQEFIDPFGPSLIASHSPAAVASSAQVHDSHRAHQLSSDAHVISQQSGEDVGISAVDHPPRDLPSVELLGSELYQLELEQHHGRM